MRELRFGLVGYHLDLLDLPVDLIEAEPLRERERPFVGAVHEGDERTRAERAAVLRERAQEGGADAMPTRAGQDARRDERVAGVARAVGDP